MWRIPVLVGNTLRAYNTMDNLLRYQLRPDWLLSYGEILISDKGFAADLLFTSFMMHIVNPDQVQRRLSKAKSLLIYKPRKYVHRNRYGSLGPFTAK